MKKTLKKGDWHIFDVESNGTTVTLKGTYNLDVSIKNNKLILPKGFTVASYFYDLHWIDPAEATLCSIVYGTDGLTSVKLPAKNFDHGYIFIRGFFS